LTQQTGGQITNVIPAKAGTQSGLMRILALGPRFRGDDKGLNSPPPCPSLRAQRGRRRPEAYQARAGFRHAALDRRAATLLAMTANDWGWVVYFRSINAKKVAGYPAASDFGEAPKGEV
jgi:hypothetical protein